MFTFKLVSLTGTKFEGEVAEVILPTLEGQIGVEAHHMPLVSVATTGVIAVRRNPKDRDSDREYFACSGGVIEVSNNVLRVLADEADSADEISESEAKAAYERAQKMLSEAKDQISLEHAQALVDRHTVRIQVASLKRRRNKN